MQTVDFRTKDLNLAAFLWCQPGAKLQKLDGEARGGSSTVFFMFTLPLSQAELQALQIAHANEETVVEPIAFCQRQNQLRDLLHTSLGSHRKSKNDRTQHG
jgi:hypothetical protein